MSENAVVPTASDAEPFSGAASPSPVKHVTQPAQPQQEEKKPVLDAKALQAQRLLRAKATVEYFAESTPFVMLMSVLTIWALYNSDIKFAATTKEADLAFEVIISIAFFLFILEIFASCFYKPDYLYIPQWKALEDEEWHETWLRRLQFGSFYFWLDWIATATLVLEVRLAIWTISQPHSHNTVLFFAFCRCRGCSAAPRTTSTAAACRPRRPATPLALAPGPGESCAWCAWCGWCG